MPDLENRRIAQRRALVYEKWIKGETDVLTLASMFNVSTSTIYSDLAAVRNEQAKWWSENQDLKERARNYLKQLLDGLDQIIKEGWSLLESKEFVMELDAKKMRFIPTFKMRILDLIRKAIVDKAGILGLHHITIRDLEMRSDLEEVKKLYEELKQVKMRRNWKDMK